MLSSLFTSSFSRLGAFRQSSRKMTNVTKASNTVTQNSSQIQNTKLDYCFIASAAISTIGTFGYFGYVAYNQTNSKFDPNNNYIIIL